MPNLFISFDDEKFYMETSGNYTKCSFKYFEKCISVALGIFGYFKDMYNKYLRVAQGMPWYFEQYQMLSGLLADIYTLLFSSFFESL